MQLSNILAAGFVLLGTQVLAQNALKALHTSETGLYPLTHPEKVLDKRCTGTCSECFGSGYLSCPGSSLYCYKPGDSLYGLDGCPGQTSSASSCASQYGSTYASCPDGSGYCYNTASSAGSSACPGSVDSTDYCTSSSSCAVCFGSGYIDCPDGSNYCYNPSDSLSHCPGSSGSVVPLKSTTAVTGTTTRPRTTTTSLADAATTATHQTTTHSTAPTTTTTSPTTVQTSRGSVTGLIASATSIAAPLPTGAASRVHSPLEAQFEGLFGFFCSLALVAAGRFIL